MSAPVLGRKKVLIVQYSQSGQLTRIVERLSRPLLQADFIDATVLTLEPQTPFPFPWPILRFFNTFPECVYYAPPPIATPALKPEDKFDLIIFAYQVWFLSPALPATAFLQHPSSQHIFKGTPVVTLIACRNMWTRAHLAVKHMLDKLGARLIDNIVLTDQSSSMASFITTPRWLLTGRKNAFWGFSAAGISEQQIAASERFGMAIVDGLRENREQNDEPLLNGLGAVNANVALIQSETIGFRSFRIWGKLLRRIGGPDSTLRKSVLLFYIVFLICMIITVVPLSLLIRKLLQPLMKKRYQQTKSYFEAPSGSSLENMDKYTCQN